MLHVNDIMLSIDDTHWYAGDPFYAGCEGGFFDIEGEGMFYLKLSLYLMQFQSHPDGWCQHGV